MHSGSQPVIDVEQTDVDHCQLIQAVGLADQFDGFAHLWPTGHRDPGAVDAREGYRACLPGHGDADKQVQRVDIQLIALAQQGAQAVTCPGQEAVAVEELLVAQNAGRRC